MGLAPIPFRGFEQVRCPSPPPAPDLDFPLTGYKRESRWAHAMMYRRRGRIDGRKFPAWFAFVAWFVAGGCAIDHGTPTVLDNGAAAALSDPAGDAEAMTDGMSHVTLRVADRGMFDEVLASHKGKPVLVDFWATWCLSCVEQFPHTVELYGKYADQGLAVVSVSLDEPEDEARVKAFLEKQRATFDNLLSAWGAEDPSFENFEISFGTLPHYKLYDRDGQIHRAFGADPTAEKPFTVADIEQGVQQLLAAEAVP